MSETEEYLGTGTEYEFNDGKKYVIKSLGVSAFGDALKIMNSISSLKNKVKAGEKPSNEDIFNAICESEVALSSMMKLISKTLREQLFPGQTDDEIAPFATSNMMVLINAVLSANLPKQNKETVDKANRLNTFREKRKNDKSATEDTV